MRKLTIGLVLDDSLDVYDGVQQYILILGRWLSSQGHDVHYLVGQTKRQDVDNLHSMSRNVRVRFNGNRMRIPLPASIKGIRQVLEEYKFDVLHVQMPFSPAMAGQVIKAAGRSTAIVGTFHILPHSKMVVAANRALSSLLRLQGSLQRFDEVIATSPPAGAFAKRVYGLDYQAIPLALPLEQFLDARPFTRYKRGKTVVYLGRLVERKGVGYLLRAVAEAVAEGAWPKDARVVICGAGPLEERLTTYALTHRLQHIVEFTGMISEQDKPRYLASADVVVYPSTGGESFGIVLLEAMAASRGMVMAGNNPGYASVMAGHEEQLFDPLDTRLLAHKLITTLKDESARAAAHDWQREYVQRFDVSAVGEEIFKVYQRALRKRQA